MDEDNIVQKIKRQKPMSKRPIGRPKTRWEDDVLEDIKNINISNWKKVEQNRDSSKKVVEQARTLCGLLRFIRRRMHLMMSMYFSRNMQMICFVFGATAPQWARAS